MGREAKCKAMRRELRQRVKAGAMSEARADEVYLRFKRPGRTEGRTGTGWQPQSWYSRAVAAKHGPKGPADGRLPTMTDARRAMARRVAGQSGL